MPPADRAGSGGIIVHRLRSAGFFQYNFFGKEKGYTLLGTALGQQKILAVNGGFDRQAPCRAYSAKVAADIPVRGGDEIGAQLQYYIHGPNLKWTVQYCRAVPASTALKPANEFSVQVQVFYF